jgi:hypothetical protein
LVVVIVAVDVWDTDDDILGVLDNDNEFAGELLLESVGKFVIVPWLVIDPDPE